MKTLFCVIAVALFFNVLAQVPCNIHECTFETAVEVVANDVTITFSSETYAYSPKCIRVASGAKVTFSGTFSGHPLVSGFYSNIFLLILLKLNTNGFFFFWSDLTSGQTTPVEDHSKHQLWDLCHIYYGPIRCQSLLLPLPYRCGHVRSRLRGRFVRGCSTHSTRCPNRYTC